jgi:hypothetical protein
MSNLAPAAGSVALPKAPAVGSMALSVSVTATINEVKA